MKDGNCYMNFSKNLILTILFIMPLHLFLSQSSTVHGAIIRGDIQKAATMKKQNIKI